MISVSIINYKTPDLVKRLVNSIRKFTTGVEYEIIIVDNASNDNSQEILKFSEKNIQIIWNKENIGFGGGHNLASKYATGEYIFFLNSDTLFFEDTLTKLRDEFKKIEKNTKIGFLQPRLFLNEKHTKTQDS